MTFEQGIHQPCAGGGIAVPLVVKIIFVLHVYFSHHLDYVDI